MYGIPDKVKPLSGAEEAVMLAVWASRPPITRQEIASHLEHKTWADATLLNFLYRLEEKGWVKSGKERNRNVYTPCVTRRAYGVWCMRERLGTLFGGDLAAAVYALTSESGSSRAQLESARRVLDEKLSETEEYDLYDPYG
jgi:predicted transcriptional regulator